MGIICLSKQKPQQTLTVTTFNLSRQPQQKMAKYITRNAKRKRRDDDKDGGETRSGNPDDIAEDQGKKSNNSKDGGNDGDTTDVRPDAALSCSSTTRIGTSEDTEELEIPEGFPSLGQLENLLTYVQKLSPATDDSGNHDDKNWTNRRDVAIKALEAMRKWADDVDDADSDVAKSHESMKFSTLFLQLGGLLRMALFIEHNMEDAKLVQLAASVLAMSVFNQTRDGGILEKTCETACYTFAQHGCFRTVILAIEEFGPAGTVEGWNAIDSLWLFIRCVTIHIFKKSFPLDMVPDIVEEIVASGIDTLNYLVSSDMVHVCNAVGNVADVLLTFIWYRKDAMVQLYKESRVLPKFQNFCDRHISDWLKGSIDNIRDILLLCRHCADRDVLSEDEMLNWAPLVGRALAENLTDDVIQSHGIKIIEIIVSKIDHRRLEKTSLPTTLVSILQSDDASYEINEKLRALVKAIYS